MACLTGIWIAACPLMLTVAACASFEDPVDAGGEGSAAITAPRTEADPPPNRDVTGTEPVARADGGRRRRIGLVLSGGGARGAAHVGVLQVLEQLRIPVDYVVGTSMGSIIGGLYSAGYSPGEMVDILAEANWPEILSDQPPRDELWFRRRQDNRRFQVDLEFGWRDGGPALPPGLILGRNVEAFLERLMIPVATTDDFDDFRLPFRCVATDLADGSAVVFERGSLAKAIRASMSLPGIFAPVFHNGRILVDGGVVDNVPIELARKLGAEIVIAIDISTPLGDAATLRSLLSVSDQVIGILMLVGPVYVGLGLTEGGNQAIYVFVGPTF